MFNNNIVHKKICDAFKEFQTKNKAKGLVGDTIKFYNDKYKYFINYLNDIGHSEKEVCSIITEEIYITYINSLFDKNTKPVTIESHNRGLKVFLRHCMKRGYMQYFPLERIKYEIDDKEIYTDNELMAVIAVPDFQNVSFAQLRNWTITMMLINICPRSKTIRLMQIKQLDFDKKKIRLQKLKSKKPYFVDMTDELEAILLTYLHRRGGSNEDYLFPKMITKKDSNSPLTKSGFRSAIKRYNIKRGVNKTSPHLYRHTVGQTWVEDNGNIYELSKLLGHSSVKVTEDFYAGKVTAVEKNEFQKHNLYNRVLSRTDKY